VLGRLDRAGPVTPGRLAEAEQISPQAIGVTLNGLVRRGLVERHADPEDGRRAVMSLTEAGLHFSALSTRLPIARSSASGSPRTSVGRQSSSYRSPGARPAALAALDPAALEPTGLCMACVPPPGFSLADTVFAWAPGLTPVVDAIAAAVLPAAIAAVTVAAAAITLVRLRMRILLGFVARTHGTRRDST